MDSAPRTSEPGGLGRGMVHRTRAQVRAGRRMGATRTIGRIARSSIGFGRAVGRYFARFLSMLVLYIGYLMQPFTQKKQALHDILAGTLVVKQQR